MASDMTRWLFVGGGVRIVQIRTNFGQHIEAVPQQSINKTHQENG